VIIAEASKAASGSSESDSTLFVMMIVLATLLVFCIIVIIGLVFRNQRMKLRTTRGIVPTSIFDHPRRGVVYNFGRVCLAACLFVCLSVRR